MGSGALSSYTFTTLEGITNPEVLPKMTDRPKYDANLGFTEERQQRGFIFKFKQNIFKAPINK